MPGKRANGGGIEVGTSITRKPGLQLRPFGEACYALGQAGEFSGSAEGHQVFCLMQEGIPEVLRCKLFSADIPD